MARTTVGLRSYSLSGFVGIRNRDGEALRRRPQGVARRCPRPNTRSPDAADRRVVAVALESRARQRSCEAGRLIPTVADKGSRRRCNREISRPTLRPSPDAYALSASGRSLEAHGLQGVAQWHSLRAAPTGGGPLNGAVRAVASAPPSAQADAEINVYGDPGAIAGKSCLPSPIRKFRRDKRWPYLPPRVASSPNVR